MLMLAFVEAGGEASHRTQGKDGDGGESSQSRNEKRKQKCVHWNDDGTAFIIRNQKQLVQDIVPLFFSSTKKFKSLTRKLYRWGFRLLRPSELKSENSEPAKPNRRRNCSEDDMVFAHDCFLRDKKTVMSKMRSITTRGIPTEHHADNDTSDGKDDSIGNDGRYQYTGGAAAKTIDGRSANTVPYATSELLNTPQGLGLLGGDISAHRTISGSSRLASLEAKTAALRQVLLHQKEREAMLLGLATSRNRSAIDTFATAAGTTALDQKRVAASRLLAGIHLQGQRAAATAATAAAMAPPAPGAASVSSIGQDVPTRPSAVLSSSSVSGRRASMPSRLPGCTAEDALSKATAETNRRLEAIAGQSTEGKLLLLQLQQRQRQQQLQQQDLQNSALKALLEQQHNTINRQSVTGLATSRRLNNPQTSQEERLRQQTQRVQQQLQQTLAQKQHIARALSMPMASSSSTVASARAGTLSTSLSGLSDRRSSSPSARGTGVNDTELRRQLALLQELCRNKSQQGQSSQQQSTTGGISMDLFNDGNLSSPQFRQVQDAIRNQLGLLPETHGQQSVSSPSQPTTAAAVLNAALSVGEQPELSALRLLGSGQSLEQSLNRFSAPASSFMQGSTVGRSRSLSTGPATSMTDALPDGPSSLLPNQAGLIRSLLLQQNFNQVAQNPTIGGGSGGGGGGGGGSGGNEAPESRNLTVDQLRRLLR